MRRGKRDVVSNAFYTSPHPFSMPKSIFSKNPKHLLPAHLAGVLVKKYVPIYIILL
jgi:hypothetical protein